MTRERNSVLHTLYTPTPRIEALSQRLGQSTLLDYARPVAGGAAAPPPGPLAGLRAEMGLAPSVSAAAAAGGSTPLLHAGHHLEGLAALGHQLLGGGGGGGSSADEGLGAEVLVSAARQALMSLEPGDLTIDQLELLAADYASLAGYELERRLLDGCGRLLKSMTRA